MGRIGQAQRQMPWGSELSEGGEERAERRVARYCISKPRHVSSQGGTVTLLRGTPE